MKDIFSSHDRLRRYRVDKYKKSIPQIASLFSRLYQLLLSSKKAQLRSQRQDGPSPQSEAKLDSSFLWKYMSAY